MPPKRTTAKAAEPVASTRPSRKRAADDDEEPKVAKKPRAAAATKPVEKAGGARASARVKAIPPKIATAKKPSTTTAAAAKKSAPAAAKSSTTKKSTAGAKASTTASATKTKAKAVAEKASPPAPKAPRVPQPKPPTFNALPSIPSLRSYPSHVFVFGNGDAGQFGLGPDVMDEIARPRLHSWIDEAIKEGKFGGDGVGLETIVAGGMHSIAVSPNGKLWSWGVNDEGALGREVVNVPNPDKEGEFFEREELESWPMAVEKLEKDGFRPVLVSVGDSLTVAVNEKGYAMGWGIFRSANGQLGFQTGDKASLIQNIPMGIPGLEKVQFCAVATGPNHAVGLSVEGKVYAWGAGEEGQLGRKIMGRRLLNGTRPDPLHLRKIVAVGAGFFHSFAVDADGAVYAWGLNQYGQLGIPINSSETIISTPTLIPSLNPSELGGARVVQVDGGEHHSVFLLSDGRVYATGRCDSGQLGLAEDHPAFVKMKAENRDSIAEPVQVFFPPPPTANEPAPEVPASKTADAGKTNNPMVKISVGPRSTLAVSKEGHAYSWGFGASCQLGLGADVEEQATPARVRWKGADEWFVEDVSAGGQHCFIVASERKVRQAAAEKPKSKAKLTNGHAEPAAEPKVNGDAAADDDARMDESA